MFSQVLEEYNRKCRENRSNLESGFKALSVVFKKDILEILESSGIHELIRNAIESSLLLNEGEILIQKELNVAIDKYYNKVWKLRSIDSILRDELKDLDIINIFILKAYIKDYESVIKLHDVIKQRSNID